MLWVLLNVLWLRPLWPRAWLDTGIANVLDIDGDGGMRNTRTIEKLSKQNRKLLRWFIVSHSFHVSVYGVWWWWWLWWWLWWWGRGRATGAAGVGMLSRYARSSFTRVIADQREQRFKDRCTATFIPLPIHERSEVLCRCRIAWEPCPPIAATTSRRVKTDDRTRPRNRNAGAVRRSPSRRWSFCS